MNIIIPADVLDIIKRINDAGYEAYIVGGCVRDYLLSREPADWDITTSATPMQVKALFKRTIDTGLQHGTVTIMMHGVGYEVTTYRIDGEYEDGRHPKEVTYTTELVEDLKRRDFTINAMAYHPDKGLIDEFGGEDDLLKGIVRAVGNPYNRFSEDALRMMRAIRFAAQLGYQIENETFEAIKELAPTLSKVSAERIQVELVKTMCSDHPEDFRLFYETGLTRIFMPEFDQVMECKQHHPHHCYSVGEHILHTLTFVEPAKDLRLAMLLHDIAKPSVLTIDEEGITHFYGHPDKSADMARKILRRLKFDNATIHMVEGLVRYHDRRIDNSMVAMRRAVNNIGKDYFPQLFDVKYADTMGQSTYLREEKLKAIADSRALYEQIIARGEPLVIKDLAVTGADLIKAGVEPGKTMGELLKAMLVDVIDEPAHNNKQYLIEHYVGKILVLFVALSIAMSMLTGCAAQRGLERDTTSTIIVPAVAGNYDSEDNAVVVSIDEETSTITLMTLYIGKQYTLNYDGATTFADKYGTGLSVAQIKAGDVVDVTFMKSRKRLNSLNLSADTFSFTNVSNFMLSNDGRFISINGEDYSLNSDLVVVTSTGQGDLMDINAVDSLTICGRDKTVYSIVVDKGHGYLRLVNEYYFVGGYLDVNSTVICQITEDMLVPVPAGTYPVTVSHLGSTGTQTLTIEEGCECEFDVGKYQGEAKYGNILFTLDPNNARIYIDGEKVDTSEVVRLEYGIHQMIAVCEGYETISRYIKVASDSANLDVIMESDGSQVPKETPSMSVSYNGVSGNGVSANDLSQTAIIGEAISQNGVVSEDGVRIISPSNMPVSPSVSPSVRPSASPSRSPLASPSADVITTTGSYKVYIDGPSGAEVYVNGNYVGIAPVSFKKEEGTVTVTLRKDGYNTRSYTLSIDGEAKDVNYSFSALTQTP